MQGEISKYEKLAQENQQTLGEIQENKLPPVISEKAKKTIIKTVRAVLGGGMVAGIAVPLVACEEAPPVVEEQLQEKGQEMFSPEVMAKKAGIQVQPLIKEKKVEESDVPTIPGLVFNQEDRKYINEAGIEVGILLENAYKKDDIWQRAIGLNPDEIRKILNENNKNGILKPPWPFNFDKDKGIEVVELTSLKGGYKYIGIKHTEPISLYAASDCTYGYKFKYIPEENDSFSSQDFSGTYFSTSFEVKNSDGKLVSVDYEIESIGLETSLALSQPWVSGRWEIQTFLNEVKIGQPIGQLLPNNPNYSFLDFRNRTDWYENPDHCQASLWMNIFSDKLGVKSDLDEILSLGEKNNKITVFVWPENSKTP